MTGSFARKHPDGHRLHLQHGPIDLVIGVDGKGRDQAYVLARQRFETILQELVDELPLLRKPPLAMPTNSTARRMHRATAPYAKNTFVTQMAAVAGAVADEILAAICSVKNITRAHVNNGGDIALYLAPGQTFRLAIAGLDNADLGRISVAAGQNISGVATSGSGGRSLSMGIADSVTVLASSAAAADVAATLIANAVDLPNHRAISRIPANQIHPDSDLGSRPVVTACLPLCPADRNRALQNGHTLARKLKSVGLISGAAVFLQGQCEILSLPTQIQTRKLHEDA